ncbi:MAG: sulfatase-like hydrolase/transferase, partial [Verrucomicrobiae bacterium]|nr:sulfatase-like hydrolase/transferase [Verrucomicrobiae bacterium]
MKSFLPCLLGCLALPLLSAAAPAHPNIVYILADDLGFGDVSCNNPDSKIPTPNVDRLATEGMRFTDAHTPSAVCTPTRYGILTGRYCWRTRLKYRVLDGFDPPLIEPDRVTVP